MSSLEVARGVGPVPARELWAPIRSEYERVVAAVLEINDEGADEPPLLMTISGIASGMRNTG